MALLQISEPDASPDPHERRLAVGIDLGTTHSLVAAVRSGVAECLPDEQGRVLLPSVVRYLADNRREIGQTALDNQATDAANTISSVKRFMGRSLADIAGREQLPYQFNEASSSVQLHTRAGVMSPVQVSGDILATLRYRAEDTLGDDLVGAVITVPAYFDDAQRQATKDAAHLAGINVLRLINEPTAAAIAYGLDNAAEGTYAVYDLGGGTFDISILKLTKGVFEVIATGGDSALGGDDYDVCLVNEVLKRHAIDAASLSADDKAALKIAARAAKEQLSTQDSATFTVAINAIGAITTAFLISEFEQLTAHLTANSLRAVKKALRDAKLTPAEIKGVVLVGGSTRMPAVQRAVAGFFGQTPLTNLNPDEVVALGAAIQANQLAGNRSADNLLLLDVVPLSLGLETMGGLSEKIIPRNTTIPTAKAQDFTTFKDGQTAMALHVVQGERETVADCRSLARFELRGIPPMVAGAARIRVTFQVDADGLLSVTAREQLSGVEVQVAVKPSYGLEDGDITRMLQDSFAHALVDKSARALAEEQVDAQRLLESVRAAMTQDHLLLSAAEQQRIHDAMAHLSVTLKATDHQAIHAATQALSKATDDFAALRMDRSVHDALAGKRVEEL